MRISDWSSDVCSSDLREIMNSLELPPEIHLEFLVRHNQVVQPIPGDINPYHVGLKIWDDIYRRYENPTSEEEIGEHTSELQSLMRISYAVFCLKKQIINLNTLN